MATIVTRIYAADKQASAAIAALKGKFAPDCISKSSEKGKVAVSVRAEFGFAKVAAAILDAQKPIEGSECTQYESNPSPFSDLISANTIMKVKPSAKLINDAAPFSKAAQIPLLSNMKPKVDLLNDPAPFSKNLGMALISKATPRVKLLENRSRTVLVK
jgi:hypothetical protein